MPNATANSWCLMSVIGKVFEVLGKVPSPCVSICALDEDDVCVGCFRTGQEISQWGLLPEDLKREIVQRANQRMAGEMAACVAAEYKRQQKVTG